MRILKFALCAAVLAAFAATIGCGGSDTEEVPRVEKAEVEEPATPPPPQPEEEVKEPEPEPPPKKAAAPPAKKSVAKKKAAPPAPAFPVVAINTNHGSIKIELRPDKAPKTVENFLSYVDDGFYDGTIFHRVMNNFMIQGGGFTREMQEKKTGLPVENEAPKAKLSNERGTIAMARTSVPHSATSQFFINHKNNRTMQTAPRPYGLDWDMSGDGWGYAVFGKVVDGMDVVDEIAAVPVGIRGSHRTVPVDPVVIESIRRVK